MGVNFNRIPVTTSIPSTPATTKPRRSRYVNRPKPTYQYQHLTTRQKYEVNTDEYSQALRLDLYAFDGSPLNPMYLAYKPPQMLPTVTLNPTSSGTGSAPKATGKSKRSVEGLEGFTEPLDKHVVSKTGKEPIDADKWWWIGVSMTGLGGLLYYCF